MRELGGRCRHGAVAARGCRRAGPRYDLYRKQGGETFHLFERYRNDEALKEHRASDHYVEYRREVGDLLEAPIESWF